MDENTSTIYIFKLRNMSMCRAMLLSPPNNYCTTFHVQDSLWCHSIFSFICMFCWSLFVFLLFVFWPLCRLSFFDWWILITPLVSSNSSCPLKSNVLACTFFLLTNSTSRHMFMDIFFLPLIY
jgi:hypothetical protein